MIVLLISAHFAYADDFYTIKTRVLYDLSLNKVDDAEITYLIINISKDDTWPGLNYEDFSRT